MTIPGTAQAADSLISQGKAVTASSIENGGTTAAGAVDGDLGTRWASAASDQQWLQVDLGSVSSISKVQLNWETAYGKAYQIQTSNDGTTWTTIYSTTTGAGGTEVLNVSGSGRYVRMNGITRGTGYGYSLWEFQVYGTLGGTPTGNPSTPTGGTCSTDNAAQGKTATASSTENGGTPASAAVDGNLGTRWSSAAADPQWLQVDLGSVQQLCKVDLKWEAAYGKSYQIQASSDGTTWATIYSTTTGAGGNETLNVSGSGRYVRLYGTQRATNYGYSLWELGVHTGGGTSTVPPVQGGGDLGPNVLVFDPSTPNIQATVDQVFAKQESNQFGTDRYALLFKPGTYNNINAQIGFYTSIAGLGLNPDDTTFNGDVTVDAGWFNGNATQNFWRSAENLHLKPVSGTDRWAVSQAAPFRRMHVEGGLNLAPPATAGRRAATSPTPRSTARSATTRSSSGTPATAPSAGSPTACGTRPSPVSRAPPPRASRTRRTPRSTPRRSRRRSRSCTWTATPTRCSCPPSAPTPAAPPGATAPRRAPRCRSASSTW
nr:discoidin domain-containing protein [Kitasatospora fiedleri]